MLKKIYGIVLRTVKYSDSSLIVEALTREFGIASFIVSGVKGGRSRHKPGFFQLGVMLEMVAYMKRSKGLSRIKEARPYYLYEKLPYQIKRSAVAQYVIELLRHTIKEPEENPELYNFVEASLKAIDHADTNLSPLPLRFSWQLMEHLGIRPEPDTTGTGMFFDLRGGQFLTSAPEHLDYIHGKSVGVVQDLLSSPELSSPIEGLSREERSLLLKQTQMYFKWHIDNFKSLNSPGILESVFR